MTAAVLSASHAPDDRDSPGRPSNNSDTKRPARLTLGTNGSGLYRRVELDDVVSAHLLAMHRAAAIGLGRYIIGATTPFTRHEHTRRGWQMFPDIDRMYVNELARRELGWSPRYDFHYVLERLCRNEDPRSPLAQAVGSKRCHRK